jgi:hypothetical protein
LGGYQERFQFVGEDQCAPPRRKDCLSFCIGKARSFLPQAYHEQEIPHHMQLLWGVAKILPMSQRAVAFEEAVREKH